MEYGASRKRKRYARDEEDAWLEDELAIQNAHTATAVDHENSEMLDDSSSSDGFSDTQSDYEYTEAQETLPACALYDSKVPSVKSRLEKLAKTARKILRESDVTTKEVEVLRRKVKELDLGESVTWVATIYRAPFHWQKKRFAVQLKYFDLETIGKLLVEAVGDWKAYHFEEHEDITPQEEDRLRNRANTALAIFRTVFCEYPEFETDEAGVQSLNRICSGTASIKQQTKSFVDHAAQIMRTINAGEDALLEADEFSELEGLHQWLSDHLDEDEGRGGPLTIIRIGVRGSRVLDRWKIADLPGLTDSNLVRVNATLRSINQCDFLWAFDHVGRIATNGVIEGLAQRYGRAFKGNVVAIGTRSAENVQAELVRAYAKKGIKIEGLQEWRASNRALTKQIKELQSSVQKKTKAANRNEGSRDAHSEIAILEKVRDDQDDEWWAKVVEGRNTFVTRELQRKCQPHLPVASTLRVFCVSNAHYAARKLNKRKENFTLSAEATGIPALRRHALALAAPEAFREVAYFVDHQYTVFIRGLELWASNRLSKGRTDLIKVIHRPQKAIPGSFELISEEIKEKCTEKVIHKLRRNQFTFASAAQKALDTKITRKRWATLRAFIVRNGNHKTAAISESWNELFTTEVRKVMEDDLWYPFVDETSSQIDELCRQVNTTIASIKEQLEREPAAVGLPMGPFDAALQAHIAGLRQAFVTTKDNLTRGLRSIILNVINDGPDNYFAHALAPAYTNCQNDSAAIPGRRCVRRDYDRLRRYDQAEKRHIF
ncbi:uncharacterized protein MYCFIDRAFT_90454 [Pseudocercospora fijiensis CIRAD86]|uniref:DUF7605 domain-containing protein n=1 Tax=Pseudocercospora fijiensis (strain CIRAD86) TaxID=383855 RepID=M2Z787_PSEFD|nr:uncharacterized protein MYCFIDRAFT_90454 [Pseudocercospora fijiensis CIRAD86]EME85650.1 hypothetical protein MYCFIDRAFT_90454 [Pseudocercospora fijiensis CIRAD86]